MDGLEDLTPEARRRVEEVERDFRAQLEEQTTGTIVLSRAGRSRVRELVADEFARLLFRCITWITLPVHDEPKPIEWICVTARVR